MSEAERAELLPEVLELLEGSLKRFEQYPNVVDAYYTGWTGSEAELKRTRPTVVAEKKVSDKTKTALSKLPHFSFFPGARKLDGLKGLEQGGFKYFGGVLARDGRIFGLPRKADNVLIVDPHTNTTDTTTITGIGDPNQDAKWLGGTVALDGRIFCAPYNASEVLIIDPAENTADTTTITGLDETSKWCGSVMAADGRIFAVPRNSDSVLIIDPITNKADTTTITGLRSNGEGDQHNWCGGVLAQDGRIFCVPRDHDAVLIIDPATNTADVTKISGLGSESNKWQGAVVAPDGRIFCIPFDHSKVLVIDPANNSYSLDSVNLDNLVGVDAEDKFKWVGGVLGPDGRVYGIPFNTDRVLIIDPDTDVANTNLQTKDGPDAERWAGAVVSQDGRIIGIPSDADSVLSLDYNEHGEPLLPPHTDLAPMVTGPFYNHF